MSCHDHPTSHADCGPAAPAAIDASCRAPGLLLLGSGLVWLVLATLTGVLASLNFHKPSLLADFTFLTYGHLKSVSGAAFLFGFGGNAVFALTLWLLARLRSVELRLPLAAALGGVIWNVGVTAGAVGILQGDATGCEGLDLPLYALRMLIAGGALLALCAVVTYAARAQAELYPSLWYILAGLVVLPVALVTIYYALGVEPVRGVAQATANWWAVSVLRNVWLGSAALAAVFYFVPKLVETPLHSRQLAGLGFWGLLIFGGWAGAHAGAPVPVWIIKMSAFASVMMIFPLLAVLWNIHRTVGGNAVLMSQDITLSYIGFALLCFLLAGVGAVLQPLHNVTTHFTLFTVALRDLWGYGFFAMTVLGAIVYITPRLVGRDWAGCGCLRGNFKMATAGVLLMVIPQLFGGWMQGGALNNATLAYANLPAKALMTLRVAFIGEVVLLVAAVMALINFARLVLPSCCGCCNPIEIFRMFKGIKPPGGAA